MAGETIITIIGNLTADPELRFTPAGAAVADFTVASTPRTFDRTTNEWKDGETLFMRCSVWRQQAENVAESLRKGMRVIVSGRLSQRSYETREGEHRTVVEMQADEVGISMRHAKAQVTRNQRAESASAPQAPQQGYAQPQQAPQRGYAQPQAPAPQRGYAQPQPQAPVQAPQQGYAQPQPPAPVQTVPAPIDDTAAW
jgi:single-strand DNA-binding protein